MSRAQRILEIFQGTDMSGIEKRRGAGMLLYSKNMNIDGNYYAVKVMVIDNYFGTGTDVAKIYWEFNDRTYRTPGDVSQKGAIRVFGAVAAMLNKAMKENNIVKIVFSADSYDVKKAMIYTKFARLLANKYNGTLDIHPGSVGSVKEFEINL